MCPHLPPGSGGSIILFSLFLLRLDRNECRRLLGRGSQTFCQSPVTEGRQRASREPRVVGVVA